ncbi:hypothetical protein ACQKCU_20635 [Heyndrickxia sporothermodurans]
MRQLLIHNLKRNKSKSLLFVLAFIVILIIMPLSSVSLQNAHTQVQTDITYYSRGTYDLLVRPQGIENELEKELGIVPENYLGFGNGGITLKQWQSIKSRKDIEIAAPVASLGYFTGVRTNIGITPPRQSTRYLMQFKTSDGVNRYPIGKELACFLLKSPNKINGFSMKFEELMNDESLINECTTSAAMFLLPPTYHLLVGIDPNEEKALTGITFDDIDEDNPSSGWGTLARNDFFPDAQTVPVIEINGGDVSLDADLKIDFLKINSSQTQEYRNQFGLVNEIGNKPYVFFNKFHTEEYNRLVKELIKYPLQKRIEISADLSKKLSAYNQEALVVNEKGQLEKMKADGVFIADTDLNYVAQYYTAGQIKYKKENNRLIVEKVDEIGGIPLYRKIKEHGINLQETFIDKNKKKEVSFVIDPVGEAKLGKLKQQLAASPLGIYQQAPIYYIGNGKNKRVQMKATITPGSFVTAPARGVTNIKSASLIKGDKPIDAIRVKVAGINSYSKKAAQKIEKIAHDIEKMGLKVTIVAGASPQKIKVNVDGVGLVEESWTTLGAAGNIVNQWNMTNIILAILFFVVTIIYVMNRMTFWQVNKLHDLTLLYQLGWDKKHLLRFSKSELGILMLFAWVLSLFALIGIQQWMNLSSLIYLWQLAITLVSLLFIYITVGRKIMKMFGPKIEKKGDHSRNVNTRKSLVSSNLQYYRRNIRSPFVQLLMVSFLSSFVYLSLTESVQQTNITLLGEYINLQVSNWHLLLIISAYLLGVFTLVESLISLLMIREKEIGTFRAIGWKISHIFKLYMKEIAIWAGASIMVGSSISLLVYSIFYSVKPSVLLIVVVSFLGFYLSILFISAIVINRYLKKELGVTLFIRRKYL